MSFRPVVFFTLLRFASAQPPNTRADLMDKCEQGMVCHALSADSFQDYAVEMVGLNRIRTLEYEFFQSKDGYATERLTKGDNWRYGRGTRTVSRHPIPGAENKMFVEFSSERAEVIKFYARGQYIIKDERGREIFRIMSDFKNREHIAVDDVKHSLIYNSWLFLNSTHAVDLKMYMRFPVSDLYKLTDSEGRIGRLDIPYWSYGVEKIENIPFEDIDRRLTRLIAQNCFRNPKKYCAVDPRDGSLHFTPYPAALRMGDFIMEQRWKKVLEDFVPIYRFHHDKMPDNEVFYFPDLYAIYPELIAKGGHQKHLTRRLAIRGIMPQPKEGDKIFELMLQRTTTTPPPTQSTPPPTSTLKPLPPEAYKPTSYTTIDEDVEEPMPVTFVELSYGQNSASDAARALVAVLLAIFMILL